MQVFGVHDLATIEQARDVASRHALFALMADGHLGYVMPVGGVSAHLTHVSIAGVGVDIGCGNAAIRTDLTVGDLSGRMEEIADSIFAQLAFGVGRVNNDATAPVDDKLFEDDAWGAVPDQARERLRERARAQIGTIGAGNHYVDVFADEAGRIWVGVHFGSRGLGHNIASNFLRMSQGDEWVDQPRDLPGVEGLVAVDSPVGHDYWHAMSLAGRYAALGREWVARKVVDILGGQELELVHNHHNFAWPETHDGREYIVVRKGATPAFPGQKGFVGGSMGDDAVILEGAVAEEGSEAEALQKKALYSTVHGAGRVMSRTKAKGKWKKGVLVAAGAVSHDAMNGWIRERGVVLRGGDLDEAPQAYRRLPEVLAAQGETVRVLHRLRPMIVAMAPGDTVDPYKD